MVTKIIIVVVLILIGLILTHLDEKESRGGFINVPGSKGFLGLGFLFSAFIVSLVFIIQWIIMNIKILILLIF